MHNWSRDVKTRVSESVIMIREMPVRGGGPARFTAKIPTQSRPTLQIHYNLAFCFTSSLIFVFLFVFLD